jgi:hypothetical protein
MHRRFEVDERTATMYVDDVVPRSASTALPAFTVEVARVVCKDFASSWTSVMRRTGKFVEGATGVKLACLRRCTRVFIELSWEVLVPVSRSISAPGVLVAGGELLHGESNTVAHIMPLVASLCVAFGMLDDAADFAETFDAFGMFDDAADFAETFDTNAGLCEQDFALDGATVCVQPARRCSRCGTRAALRRRVLRTWSRVESFRDFVKRPPAIDLCAAHQDISRWPTPPVHLRDAPSEFDPHAVAYLRIGYTAALCVNRPAGSYSALPASLAAALATLPAAVRAIVADSLVALGESAP